MHTDSAMRLGFHAEDPQEWLQKAVADEHRGEKKRAAMLYSGDTLGK